MMINFLISYILGFIILFLVYNMHYMKDKKIPQSISATVCSLDKKNKWLIYHCNGQFLIAPHFFL